MPQLHLPRASYDLFIYDFRYNFSGTAEYNSMQTVRTFTLARERINKMYGFAVGTQRAYFELKYFKIVKMRDAKYSLKMAAEKWRQMFPFLNALYS